ncbi:DNA-binding response regulator [Geothrix limicola]|uniref:DNA-binding response regulator n=1 Tax=Geothrix limicola TaxID=2927978 RepID=A0ABQ5QED7_9BACT|nr:response regulator transcription factor [Geothrix limicola]GLH72748.1 DNA-binding response regulator [Geothrix limicola]
MWRILLTDDHALLRSGLRRILEEALPGVCVGEAGSVEEAVKALEKGQWDLLVLDISLPGRSGLDALPDIKAAYPTVPVLVLSMFGEQQFAIRALKAGASAYLTKEHAPEELIKAIRTVLGGKRYIGSALAESLAAHVALDRVGAPHEQLSAREFEVFRLIASAKGMTEIAEELGLSVKTVSTYRTRILEKMQLSSNAELMQYALRQGLVE